MPVLVKFSSDWADEFQCEEFKLIEANSVEEAKEKIQAGLDECDGEIFFGTNEFFDKDRLRLDVEYTFHVLTDEEAAVITKFFTRYGDTVQFGTGIL